MPIGTALHERTFPLCESLSYREWSGYYAVSAYEAHHEHEYNAIRNAAALIDISPLFKYRISGKDATRLVDRIVTRDLKKVSVGSVIYTPWCDEHGKVIDDGTVSRLAENTYRWTAADPSLRWFQQNARGLDVSIEDISEEVAAVALQGPTSGRMLKAIAEADVENLKYFKVTSGKIAGVPVDISRTGYTGDLGYEIWMPWKDAVKVWDELWSKGKAFDIHAAGMLALDVSRIEAGLLLIDVDFNGSKKALIGLQKYTPLEMGLARLVALDKGRFVGQEALRAEAKTGPAREIVGLELDWNAVEAIYERLNLAPQIPATASRVAVPGLPRGRAGRQGDVDDVVADAQEDDRAGDGRPRLQRRRDAARDGGHGRGRAPPRAGDRRQDAVLQPSEEDRHARALTAALEPDREDSWNRRSNRSWAPTTRAAPLEEAWTIPAPWYVDERIAELERRTVFSRTWQMVGRLDQLEKPGQYITTVLAGEPIVVVRGDDGLLRGFFNVCRHHAAAVMTEAEGKAPILRCPYHGWTYSLAGELKGTPDFAGVCGFDKARNGLMPVETASWEKFVFVRLEPGGPSLEESLGPPRRPVREARSGPLPLRGAAALDLRVQLEGVRRQLPRRRLPRAAPAQEPLLGPRLQPVHDRDRRQLVPPVEPDRPLERRGRRRARCAAATGRSTTGSTRTS